MLFGIIIVLFLLVCIFLVMLVLIQSDKGGGISGALGGGLSAASNMLGTQDTANILTRATTISASLFMAFCVVIFIFVAKTGEKQQKSVLKARAEKQQNYNPSSVLGGNGGLPLSQPIPGNQSPGPAQQAPAPTGTQPGSIPLQGPAPAQ